MATSKSLEEFAKAMKNRGDGILKNVEKTVTLAAITANDSLALTTPVRTGRARANWQASIGAPVYTNDEPPVEGSGQASTELVKSRSRAVIFSWRVGKGPINIANGVPYIKKLEAGSSTQAPHGMLHRAAQSMAFVVRRAKLLDK